MSVVPQIGSQSTVDGVFTKLRIGIISGEIASGSKISEPELARLYNVSRSTVREAIGRLESAHLVTRKANVGARVVNLGSKELIEIFLVRESLEGMACRLAAERMSDDEIDGLEQLVVGNLQSGEIEEEVILKEGNSGDLDFHYRIIYGSGNTRLIQMLCDELYPQVSMYRYQFAIGSSRVKTGFNEHLHILQAIKNRDPELAEILMRRHIRASRLNIERQLMEQSG